MAPGRGRGPGPRGGRGGIQPPSLLLAVQRPEQQPDRRDRTRCLPGPPLPELTVSSGAKAPAGVPGVSQGGRQGRKPLRWVLEREHSPDPASTGLPSAAKSRVAMPSIPFPAGGPSAAGRGGGTQGRSACKIRQSCCPGDHAALPTTVGIFPACFVAVMGLGPAFLLALPPTEAQHAMLLSLPQVTYNGAPTSSSGDVCHTCGFRPQQALIPSCREDAEEAFSSTSLQHFPFSRVSWVGVGGL